MNRFYLPPTSIDGDVVRFSEEQRKQIHNVLRMRTGDHVAVFDGSGNEYAVELMSSDTECFGRITGSKVLDTESSVNLTLIQSLPKGEKTEWIIQKGTEVGVSRFIFMTTSRSVPCISADKLPGRLSRWRNIAREAAEQSGRACVPEVDGILTFQQALDIAGKSSIGIIAWEEEKSETLQGVIPRLAASGDVSLLIGPEGGFTSDEVSNAKAAGITPISLGKRILRTETAAVVGAALVIYGRGG